MRPECPAQFYVCKFRCHLRYLALYWRPTHVGPQDSHTRQTRQPQYNSYNVSALLPGFQRRASVGPMSDTQFTALDWRPSRKRATYPRQRAWGGQKEAPAAFLAAARLTGLAHLPRCDHCRRVAMRGLNVCRAHGGGKIASQSRPYAKSVKTLVKFAAVNGEARRRKRAGSAADTD